MDSEGDKKGHCDHEHSRSQEVRRRDRDPKDGRGDRDSNDQRGRRDHGDERDRRDDHAQRGQRDPRSHGDRPYEVLVVGAGPAGIAAACSAARAGARVGLVDDNPAPGGQIWRGEESHPASRLAATWLRRIRREIEEGSVQLHSGLRVVHGVRSPEPGRLIAESAREARVLRFERLVLATGARELFLPFPGWTLPGVTGAGGLQALVKGGLPIEGKKVVVAGTGPLLLAVAAHLKERGADVRLVAEQAPRSRLLSFAAALLAHPGKLLQGVSLKSRLRGVPYRTGTWPVAASGNAAVERVTMRCGDATWDEPCEYLACGFGLVPQTELASLLGCEVGEQGVKVDRWQETTVKDLFCAGESTGVGGAELAIAEGCIAGFAAADDADSARAWFGSRKRWRRFARALDRTFRLRPEMKDLPAPDTVVCRCEDVCHGALKEYGSWREAKLQGRCGMGPCQGRTCGDAASFLFGWRADSVRPPIFPARISTLVSCASAEACLEQASQASRTSGTSQTQQTS